MKHFFSILFALVFGLVSLSAQSPAKPWKFKHEKSDIKVFYKNDGSGIYDLKLVTNLDGYSMEAVAAILMDVEAYTQWVYKTSESWRVRTVSETEMVYYNVSDFPWPMADRDVILTSKISYNSDSKTLISGSKATSTGVDKRDDRVRMDLVDVKWTCIEKSDGKIEIEYTLKSDPGGLLPDWAVNMALDFGPVETMKAFKKKIGESKYKDADVSFVD